MSEYAYVTYPSKTTPHYKHSILDTYKNSLVIKRNALCLIRLYSRIGLPCLTRGPDQPIGIQDSDFQQMWMLREIQPRRRATKIDYTQFTMKMNLLLRSLPSFSWTQCAIGGALVVSYGIWHLSQHSMLISCSTSSFILSKQFIIYYSTLLPSFLVPKLRPSRMRGTAISGMVNPIYPT